MSNLNTHGVTDFESAREFLGDKSRRQLCFATTLTHEATVRGDADTTQITVRHHGSPSSSTSATARSTSRTRDGCRRRPRTDSTD